MDQARATRMDEWVMWETATRGVNLHTFHFLSSISFVRGTHTPRLAHSALLGATDSLCCSSPAVGRELVSIC
jgi:hypothetical protein